MIKDKFSELCILETGFFFKIWFSHLIDSFAGYTFLDMKYFPQNVEAFISLFLTSIILPENMSSLLIEEFSKRCSENETERIVNDFAF